VEQTIHEAFAGNSVASEIYQRKEFLPNASHHLLPISGYSADFLDLLKKVSGFLLQNIEFLE
jgi:hypothetical protein